MRVRLLVLFILLLVSADVSGTHIVGGELNYRKLSGNDYEIKLTVYRDCFNGIPLFDNPAVVGVFDSNNSLITFLSMSFLGSDTIENGINSACFIPPTNVCYEVTTYIDTINLPPIQGGYQLSYQRCCRNQTIQNIIDPLMTGATFFAYIPGPGLAATNSNPVFINWPPPFICQNVPWTFDHSAIDYDGDSLVYQLCTPWNGASQNTPMPQPPFNPPYVNVQWNPPYGLNNVLGGIPLTIDPATGQITATPNTVGQFVAGVCVNEYRQGTLISQTRRDFQVNVLPCPNLIVAAIQSPLIVCGSNTVTFLNNSIGAATFFWDFGVDTSMADTSIVFSPSYTFPDTGLYTITLIAYSGVNPGCSDTTKNDILILPAYEADFSYTNIACTREIMFNDTVTSGSFDVTNSWLWKFGDNTNSTLEDPTHLYAASGIYNVQLIGTSIRGCIDTIVKQVLVPEPVTVSAIAVTNTSCHDTCDAIAIAQAGGDNVPIQFLWSDPAMQITASATGLCAGLYTVTVTDNDGCTTSDTITISSPPPLTLSLSSTDAYCGGRCIGTASAAVNGGTSPYSIIWNDSASQSGPRAKALCAGFYSPLVTDMKGCRITSTIEILSTNDLPHVVVSADDTIIYRGDQTVLHGSGSNLGYIFNWSPFISLNSTVVSDPNAMPLQTTTYLLTIEDSNGCRNTDSITIYVRIALCEEPEIFVPNAFSPNGDNNNDILFVRGNGIKELEFSVYNRWGEKVFTTTVQSIGWDGSFRGEPVTPGVFVYHLSAVCFGESTFIKKGNVTVIR